MNKGLSLYNYKRCASSIARDLKYGKAVISAIWFCQSEIEITCVLKTAREAEQFRGETSQ